MKLVYTLLFCVASYLSFAQSPGQIVRPVGAGATALNPNADGYSSATTGGFTTNDITQSEIPFKIVPPAITEPTGDLATGPSGGFTDIVKTVDNSGFYVYNSGTNMFFRLRIGGIIAGSKGYSILIDTDGKAGNSGPSADPNYVAPTNTSNGNIGFEYEVVLQTNFQVAVYNVDGTTSPGAPVATYSLATNSQISMALSTNGNNPDYFYDWFVPLTAIGSPTSIRMSATTVTSPNSALQGSRSDIYGIDDANTTPASAWLKVLTAQPVIPIGNLGSGGSGVQPVCTAPPTLIAPINTGAGVNVTGSWTRMDVSKPSTATITLYRNGISVGTTSVTTGNNWSINVATVSPGDIFYAKAVAAGETECLQSDNVTAGCVSVPASPTITCASTKGITGTIPLGATINIYQVTTTNAVPTTTSLTTGLVYTNNAGDRTFNYFGSNPQSGNACQGQNGILTTNTTYMMVANNGGCLSAPTFICITGSSQNSWNYIAANTIALTTPIYPYQTTVAGTGATTGQLLRLFRNNEYISSQTATGSAFTFTGLSLKRGDSLKVYAQASSACMTVSPTFFVSCYTQPPLITTNTSGNLLSSSTSVSGTGIAGASITLYRGTSPSGVSVGTTAVNGSGVWTISSLTLTGGENYYATQTASSCTSPSSAAASVLAPTTACPTFSAATYSDAVASIGGSITSFTGTVRVYLDGVQIGSTALSAATTWSIPVNTGYSNTLYPGGVLTVAAQATGSAENFSCASSATVNCSSPSQPTITPTAATISTGSNVNFSVSNVVANTWYAVSDNTGASFATSVYTGNSNSFSLPTNNFSTAGTYSLKVTADKLTGCAASFRNATITVNNIMLAVQFVDVQAQRGNDKSVLVRWKVSNEQDVKWYAVERSVDGRIYEQAGVVHFIAVSSAINSYSFDDKNAPSDQKLYYRIKQLDKNGNAAYSTVVVVHTRNVSAIELSPNPANDRSVVTIQSSKEQRATIQLLDAKGSVVYQKDYDIVKGQNSLLIEGLRKFAGEMLVVKIRVNDETIIKRLLVL